VDFSADTVTDLKGQSGTVYGITKGYAVGNLTFYADKWNGSTNDGEFSISGDGFTTNARSTVTKSYFFGSQRVAMRQGSILTYLHGDHLGSASLSTNASGGKTAEMRAACTLGALSVWRTAQRRRVHRPPLHRAT